MRKLLGAVFLCLACTLAIGQVVPATPAASAASFPRREPVTTPATMEAAVLKEQLRVMREYHSSLLDTVYWALSGVTTVVLVLAGFGWWSNFKVYEQDKARLKEELAAQLRGSEATLALKIEEGRNLTERSASAKLDLELSRILPQLAELRQLVTSERESRTAAVDGTASSVAELRRELESLTSHMALAEANLRQVEEHVWDIKKIPDNVLITQLQGLAAARAAKNDSATKYVLHRMRSTLQGSYAGGKGELDEQMVDLVDKEMTELPAEHAALATEIRKLVKQVAAAPEPPDDGDGQSHS